MAVVPITGRQTGHKAGSGLPTQLRRKPLQAAWRTVQSVLGEATVTQLDELRADILRHSHRHTLVRINVT